MPRDGLISLAEKRKRNKAKRLASPPLVEKYEFLTQDVRVDMGGGAYVVLPVTLLSWMAAVDVYGPKMLVMSVQFDKRGFLRRNVVGNGYEYVTTPNTGNRIKRKKFKNGLVELYQVPAPASGPVR